MNRIEPWIETIDGRAPILLIAPHGGRAGSASRAKLNPKVNDLHTAEITRELARRLDAPAIINSGMDRNQLDCNRLPQLIADAPWLLDLIADKLESLVSANLHATVLLIHGWNIIQPRIDFGLGLRRFGMELRPPGAARVSASDDFINGTLAALANRLDQSGVSPSHGMRYPGGGAHNLLQAFTSRHCDSPNPALAKIASISARGAVDAAQLELSVAVRMPGPMRERCLDSLTYAFANHRPITPRARASEPLTIIRSHAPRQVAPRGAAVAPPSRIGIELFDPAARIGAMASFDLGPGGFGARIMLLLGARRVALFTGEGVVQRTDATLSLGPLSLAARDGGLDLRFCGPAVIVPDGAAYLSIERALSDGELDASLDVRAHVALSAGSVDFAQAFAAVDGAQQPGSPPSSFGAVEGTVTVAGASTPINAVARAGLSFTGLGPQRFDSRRMMWACFPGDRGPRAMELRSVLVDGGENQRTGRVLGARGWSDCNVSRVDIDAPSIDAPPASVAAQFTHAGGGNQSLIGHVESFIPLSRPGPDQTRIYTALGFATFNLGENRGAGMFEFSRRSDTLAGANDADDESSGDDD
ncbi:MAG: hypothetical protein ACREQF_06055 [Candidatus Binataceae bacterium]